MKNIIFLLFVAFGLNATVHGQKKSATLYTEHEAIDKVNTIWTAFINGDKESTTQFYAKEVKVSVNGKWPEVFTKKRFIGGIDWWQANFENLIIKNPQPKDIIAEAVTATEYKNHPGVWVEKQFKFRAYHKSSGIQVTLNMKAIYHFNDDGKVISIAYYYNDDIFEHINNSHKKLKAGVIYKSHPYINTVRRMLHTAYIKQNQEETMSYFAENAMYWSSTMKAYEQKKMSDLDFSELFSKEITYWLSPIIESNCIYREDQNLYEVQASWNVTKTKGDTKVKYPVMASYSFDDHGKIKMTRSFFSTNHFEKK